MNCYKLYIVYHSRERGTERQAIKRWKLLELGQMRFLAKTLRYNVALLRVELQAPARGVGSTMPRRIKTSHAYVA